MLQTPARNDAILFDLCDCVTISPESSPLRIKGLAGRKQCRLGRVVMSAKETSVAELRAQTKAVADKLLENDPLGYPSQVPSVPVRRPGGTDNCVVCVHMRKSNPWGGDDLLVEVGLVSFSYAMIMLILSGTELTPAIPTPLLSVTFSGAVSYLAGKSYSGCQNPACAVLRLRRLHYTTRDAGVTRVGEKGAVARVPGAARLDIRARLSLAVSTRTEAQTTMKVDLRLVSG
jgi:hypothetical protein